MNPWLLLGIGAAWVASVAGAGVAAYQAGQDNVTVFNAKAEQIMRDTREAAQTGAAAEIAKIKPRNVTIRQETEREVRENTIYRDCRATANGVRLVNEALTGQPAQPASSGELPVAKPAQ